MCNPRLLYPAVVAAPLHRFKRYDGASGGKWTRSVSNSSINCSFCTLTWCNMKARAKRDIVRARCYRHLDAPHPQIGTQPLSDSRQHFVATSFLRRVEGNGEGGVVLEAASGDTQQCLTLCFVNRLYSSNMEVKFHRCNFLRHATTVPARRK